MQQRAELGLAAFDFVTQLFRDIEQQRQSHAPASGPPKGLTGRRPRASATLGRGR
jgi:hypothetical protein